MVRHLLRTVFLAAMLNIALADSTSGQQDWSRVRSVAVTGTSVAHAAPDTVVWSLSITDTSPQLSVAREANDGHVAKMLGLREPMGIEAADLQTGYLDVDKIFERDREGNEREFRHYRVTRSATIRQKNLKRFDAMLQALSEIENISINYSLESSKAPEIRFETRLEAIKAAKKKAGAMTELLGGVLGQVLSIDETSQASLWSNPTSNSMFAMGPPATPDDIRGSFAPGAIEIRVSVNVRFEIR